MRTNLDYVGRTVLSRDGRHEGKITAVTARHCGVESCGYPTLRAKWDDGKVTYPCAGGLSLDGRGRLKIGRGAS